MKTQVAVFWNVAPCINVVGTNVSEDLATSIFRVSQPRWTRPKESCIYVYFML